jgi:N utilization substance protein A
MSKEKDLLILVESVANEKGVERGVIFKALEAALAAVMRKRSGADWDVRVAIDRKTGHHEAFRCWQVVANAEAVAEHPDRLMSLADAQHKQPDIKLGETLEHAVEAIDFGRIDAQAAKQVIIQKVREAERSRVVEAYRHRIGELITGTVKKFERGGMILEMLDGAEVLVPRDQMVASAREAVRSGDTVRVYLYQVNEADAQIRGPQLLASRIAPELLVELFKLEVPEVADGNIEIMGVARDAGSRAKIAIRPRSKRLDPAAAMGACIGMHRSRIEAVSRQLAGERIDVVLWDEDLARYVINAMSPAKVISIVVDEESRNVDVGVDESFLALAIGRGGQNVRLASQLIGWTLTVMTAQDADQKKRSETRRLQKLFSEQLGVSDDLAELLVREGFSSLDELAYVPTQEFLAIPDFDEDLVEELRVRARDALLVQAMGALGGESAPAMLSDLPAMDATTLAALATLNIHDTATLAGQSVQDLLEIDGMSEAHAAQLILAARNQVPNWFEPDVNQATPLRQLSLIDATLAEHLMQHEVRSLEQLAEQSTPDLMAMAIEGLEEAQAGRIIMAARAVVYAV